MGLEGAPDRVVEGARDHGPGPTPGVDVLCLPGPGQRVVELVRGDVAACGVQRLLNNHGRLDVADVVLEGDARRLGVCRRRSPRFPNLGQPTQPVVGQLRRTPVGVHGLRRQAPGGFKGGGRLPPQHILVNGLGDRPAARRCVRCLAGVAAYVGRFRDAAVGVMLRRRCGQVDRLTGVVLLEHLGPGDRTTGRGRAPVEAVVAGAVVADHVLVGQITTVDPCAVHRELPHPRHHVHQPPAGVRERVPGVAGIVGQGALLVIGDRVVAGVVRRAPPCRSCRAWSARWWSGVRDRRRAWFGYAFPAILANRACTVEPWIVRLAVGADCQGSCTVAETSGPPGPLRTMLSRGHAGEGVLVVRGRDVADLDGGQRRSAAGRGRRSCPEEAGFGLGPLGAVALGGGDGVVTAPHRPGLVLGLDKPVVVGVVPGRIALCSRSGSTPGCPWRSGSASTTSFTTYLWKKSVIGVFDPSAFHFTG